MTIVGWALLCLAPNQDPDSLPLLGTNLAPIESRTTQWPFVDIMRIAEPWSSLDGSPLETDASGNIVRLRPGQVAETRMYVDGHHPVGQYTLSWTGKGQIETGVNSKLEPAEDGSAKISVSEGGPIVLRLAQIDPSDPPRNLRLWMPQHPQAGTHSPHHPLFLQRMGLYRVLRFAGWTRPNSEKNTKWGDRAREDDATYAWRGVPFETVFAFCRERNVSPWVCVPLRADDEFVRELAKLAMAMTEPRIRLYVEYGDEAWTTSYAQDKGLELRLSSDAKTAGLRFSAKRAAEVFSIFESVLGGTSRLVRIWSGPAEDTVALNDTLGWEGTAKHVDALSVQALFGQSLGKSGGSHPKSLDEVFQAMSNEADQEARARIRETVKIARRHRVLLVSHRAGQALVAEDSKDTARNQLFDEANRDDRMREAYVKFFQMWREEGGSLVMHTADCSPLRSDGRWGALEHQSQDSHSAPKHQGLMEYGLFGR
ncbi:MAG: hypothetical protein KF884_11960 [Fimbriimonadaceae bacterium]|nr:hypothetical protein [Fimbriimonadaceae bacterium]QYK58257.1 MAG: hypothetical protein KF884_11960 [Fimbriimonadaceae bacterium]